MKKMHKGFTLVELLIVVAILATLTAAMTASISGSTAKAKAAMIANNVEVMKSAATQYYIENMEDSKQLVKSIKSLLCEIRRPFPESGIEKISYTVYLTDPTTQYK